MPSQSERRDKTRAKILAVGRKLFGKKGYDAVTIDEIAKTAGIAKGAIYHHYQSKHILFEAVYIELSGELSGEVVGELDTAADYKERIIAGCRKFFQVCKSKKTSRILLQDGPAVLGWDRWREIDYQNFSKHLIDAIKQGIDCGEISDENINFRIRIFIGAVGEGVRDSGSYGDYDMASNGYINCLSELLEGWRK